MVVTITIARAMMPVVSAEAGTGIGVDCGGRSVSVFVGTGVGVRSVAASAWPLAVTFGVVEAAA